MYSLSFYIKILFLQLVPKRKYKIVIPKYFKISLYLNSLILCIYNILIADSISSKLDFLKYNAFHIYKSR